MLPNALAKSPIRITNFIFDLRHPERRRAPLPPLKSASTKEKLLIQEWARIRDNIVLPWIQRQRRGEQIEVAAKKRMLCGSILATFRTWKTGSQ